MMCTFLGNLSSLFKIQVLNFACITNLHIVSDMVLSLLFGRFNNLQRSDLPWQVKETEKDCKERQLNSAWEIDDNARTFYLYQTGSGIFEKINKNQKRPDSIVQVFEYSFADDL